MRQYKKKTATCAVKSTTYKVGCQNTKCSDNYEFQFSCHGAI